MKGEQVEIKFIDSWKNAEIVDLYKAGGWWRDSYDASAIELLITLIEIIS